jgi:hypothetical protein
MGCSQSSSSGGAADASTTDPSLLDASTGDAAKDASALPYPLSQACTPATVDGDACLSCAETFCCQSRDAYLASADAVALQKCLAPSTCDTTCEAACFDAHKSGTKPFLDHLGCVNNRCVSQCGGTPTPCSTCTAQKCITQSTACDVDQSCFLLVSCQAPCAPGDQACLDACVTKFPDGKKTHDALLVCTSSRCQTECSN